MALKEPTISETKLAHLKMSYEEFLQWADEDTHAEWVEGEVIVHMPPKDIHQTTSGFLYWLLRSFVDLFNLGKVVIAPFEVKLKPDGPAREPDIFFIAQENLNRLTEERFVGPPDLIIEIISKESAHRDRHQKFNEYCQAGVREYWLIDSRPHKQGADFFYLNEQNEYELFATEEDERVESRVLPGFWLRPDWLWRVETLNPLTIFFENMGGMSSEQVKEIQQTLRRGFSKDKD